MPRIDAYHPEIAVEKNDGTVLVIRPDMDNYYTDQEVLETLAESAGVGTIGEIVESLQNRTMAYGLKDNPAGVLACRVEQGDESYQLRHKWDDPV